MDSTLKVANIEKRLQRLEKEFAAISMKIKYLREDISRIKSSELQAIEEVIFPTAKIPHDP